MQIQFNNPEYVKQRQEVKPLSLEEMTYAIDIINDMYCKVQTHNLPTIDEINLVQRLIFEYENLKHSNEVKCQCCYKNTTADIDVNYELVNSKTNE